MYLTVILKHLIAVFTPISFHNNVCTKQYHITIDVLPVSEVEADYKNAKLEYVTHAKHRLGNTGKTMIQRKFKAKTYTHANTVFWKLPTKSQTTMLSLLASKSFLYAFMCYKQGRKFMCYNVREERVQRFKCIPPCSFLTLMSTYILLYSCKNVGKVTGVKVYTVTNYLMLEDVHTS